jgi:nitroreductase
MAISASIDCIGGIGCISSILGFGRTGSSGIDRGSCTFPRVELETAIRTRRTHKAFGPEPVPDQLLDEMLELARWAPNHNVTNPWRFRIIGPQARERLKHAAGPEGAAKIDRAPTLIAITAKRSAEDPVQEEEDLLATACAAFVVLLAAHDRGLAAYWRTPGVLRTPEGLAALQIPDDERFVALLYLGTPREERRTPERAAAADVVVRLD